MNQPGTGSPRPSETSRATQDEPLAIDQLTPGASKPPHTDHVCEEGRSSGEARYLTQHARLILNQYARRVLNDHTRLLLRRSRQPRLCPEPYPALLV